MPRETADVTLLVYHLTTTLAVSSSASMSATPMGMLVAGIGRSSVVVGRMWRAALKTFRSAVRPISFFGGTFLFTLQSSLSLFENLNYLQSVD
jgi:hypothetical protein